MPSGISNDHLHGLTWERLDHVLDIRPELGLVFWKNPSGKRAEFLKGKIAGSAHKRYKYISVCIDYNDYKIHRLIWFYVHKKWPVKDLDHINCDRTDNRISNLREATRAQNMWNMKLPKKNTSGKKGVCWNSSHGKWRATIKYNGLYIGLGLFDKFEDAVQARIVGEQTYHKEYARTDV